MSLMFLLLVLCEFEEVFEELRYKDGTCSVLHELRMSLMFLLLVLCKFEKVFEELRYKDGTCSVLRELRMSLMFLLLVLGEFEKVFEELRYKDGTCSALELILPPDPPVRRTLGSPRPAGGTALQHGGQSPRLTCVIFDA